MDLMAVSKALGILTIFMSSVMKLPQLLRIFQSKSALGVSLSSLSLELLCYTVGSLYGFRNGYSVTIYGELILLLLQNALLHAMIVYYERLMSGKVVAASLVYVSFVSVVAVGIVPLSMLKVIFSFNLPIVILSKIAQIRALYSSGTAGQISLATWTLALSGCVFRIFTNLVETKDVIILANYSVGVVLNSVIVAMIVYYQSKDKKNTSKSD